jgi:signal transduction histidine kinase
VEFPEDEIGALLAVPIVGRSSILGVMRVVRRQSPKAWFSNAFSEGEERILTSIGRQVGAAVENVRSYERLVHAERMAAWGELSARAAHMIGNRTFAIKGDLNELTYLLDEKPCEQIRSEIKELAASMNHGIARLEEILREFRDFVVATQLSLGSSKVNDVILEAVAETFPKRSPIVLRTELAEDLPALRCDARKLKRAFAELIENAVTFQPDGGLLAVRSSAVGPGGELKHDLEQGRAGAPVLPGGLAQGRDYVCIEFRDGGPGVPAEEKDRIFLPFHTTRAKGMGLGLSIVKGIVEAHQGLVREVGEAGDGARFVVCLPVPDAIRSE